MRNHGAAVMISVMVSVLALMSASENTVAVRNAANDHAMPIANKNGNSENIVIRTLAISSLPFDRLQYGMDTCVVCKYNTQRISSDKQLQSYPF